MQNFVLKFLAISKKIGKKLQETTFCRIDVVEKPSAAVTTVLCQWTVGYSRE